MLYLLPTRATRRYTGKWPNRIHSMSFGKDRDGASAMHFETNCGERYTCSYDRLLMERVNRTRTFVGTSFTEFLKNGTAVNTMTAEQYSDWLREIHAARDAARETRK